MSVKRSSTVTHTHSFKGWGCITQQSSCHTLCSFNNTHRFLLRLSPCDGLCFSFSLHLSPSESDDSDSDDSLEDDDEEEDEEEDAEEDESDWTPVGSSMCTLSAICATSGLSFCLKKTMTQ